MTRSTASERRHGVRATTEKGVVHFLALGLSGGLLVLVVALAIAVIVVPKAADAIPLTVLTSSMKPSLPPGTLIVVRPVDPVDLAVGDVATYQIESGKPGVITHRITAISSSTNGTRTFTFQGDNNSAPDSDQILEEQIQGELWYSIPFIGYVNTAVNGANRSWIIPALATALFGYAAYMVASGIRASVIEKRRRRTPPE